MEFKDLWFFIFSIITLIFLVIILIFSLKRKELEPKDLEIAIPKALKEIKLDETIGGVKTIAEEIRNANLSLERMFKIPQERGYFGELGLEILLSSVLPPSSFGMRERLPNGKIPDAYIKSPEGIISIDSKFPLENYRHMIEATTQDEKEAYKKQFIKDTKGHLEKILQDYVITEDKDFAPFAITYIPAESVFYFLLEEAQEMLQDYARKRVQVVSPLTMASVIEFIKGGIHVKRVEENIKNVLKSLDILSKNFETLENLWKTYQTHLKNAYLKAEEVDSQYKKLKEEFERVKNLPD